MTKGRTITYVHDDETTFLNVDVEITAASSLDPLIAALGDKVSVHYVGRPGRGAFLARFSLYHPKGADAAIRTLGQRIESLPRSARRQWKDARTRVFDIGFQVGLKPHSKEYDLSEESVALIARLRGSIKITLYVAPGVKRSQI